MTETLEVHVNRDGPNAIEAPPSFRATGTFPVRIRNHGAPTHVHLHLDDSLSRTATIGADNRYVEDETVVTVDVRDGPRPVEGQLKVVTGYGRQTARVAVDVEEPTELERGVAVDESLAKPARRDAAPDERAAPTELLDGNLALVALAVVAVGLAAAALSVSDALTVVAGVLAVLVGVGVAVFVLRDGG